MDVELQSVRTPDGTIQLLGICEGLDGEAEAVVRALEANPPASVALALEPSMIDEVQHWERSEHLDREDKVYKQGLSRFGPVVLPPGEYAAALEAAEELGASVHGIDIGESTYMSRFTEEVSIWDLFAKTWRLRRLGKKPPKAGSPEAFCIAFDQRLNKGSFGLLEDLREGQIAERTMELTGQGPVAVVLPIPRLSGVARRLEDPQPRP